MNSYPSGGNARDGQRSDPVIFDEITAPLGGNGEGLVLLQLLSVDTAGSDLDVLRSHDWSRWRPKAIAVHDRAPAARGGDIRTFLEGLGYRLVGHLFDTWFYASPELVKSTAGNGGSATGRVDPTQASNGDLTPNPARDVARHHFAEAQAASLSRQLQALRTEHEALQSTLAWRLAAPIHKFEKEYRRWQLRRLERRDPELNRPQRALALAAPQATEFEKQEAAHRASALAGEPDNFVLYRIVGNDLLPRHRKGQSRDNVAFILANEPELEDCEKRWVVNRITDPAMEAEIVSIIEDSGHKYIRIPFDLDQYARIEWALEDFPEPGFLLSPRFLQLEDRAQRRALLHIRWRKNAYVMNNNGARNAALSDGREAAKWILPWDGNCFISGEAWRSIRGAVRAKPYLRYFTVPMARIVDDSELHSARLQEKAREEPQIIFRRDAGETFDERCVYGRRSKVELLVRLGISGPWDRWENDPWDLAMKAASDETGQYATIGWVARLNSGVPELESAGAIALRGQTRADAITSKLDELDRLVLANRLDPTFLAFYDEAALDRLSSERESLPLADRLRCDADAALARGPYSVVDKTTLPPSGDPHDYWHVSPYWWPNPDTPDGLPYIRRDGQRLPGTELYAPGSEQFDRTRLQRLFDDTTLTALAWRVHADDRYIEHAAKLIRHWFIDPQTRMNPHLRFAQVRRGHDGDQGNTHGVIEFKDIYYFLDAVRLVARAGALSDIDLATFRSWLRAYLAWLESSRQGVEQSRAPNNHGTAYDLQLAAIGAYLGKTDTLVRAFRYARERILMQFDATGAQPHELERTMTRHYCCFNLQCWTSLARIADSCGEHLWSYRSSDGRGIVQALLWLRDAFRGGPWAYSDIADFDEGRLVPLMWDLERHHGRSAGGKIKPTLDQRPLYYPHHGIAPYWMTARV